MSTRVSVEVPSVAHKGPHDTDARFFRQVADRLDEGYGRELSGGNVRRAVEHLLRAVADALEAQANDGADRSDAPPAPWVVVLDHGAEAPLFYIVQCAFCTARAGMATQPDGDWTCPRCTEVAGGFGDVDVAAAERPDERQNRLIGIAIDVAHATSQPAGCAWDGDEWWLNKVRG